MANTSLCLLVFMVNTLARCGHGEENLRPVLSVSSSWLSPGASVTLNCTVKAPGWKILWYKALPRRFNNSYKYKLLSKSSSGAEERSYIVGGQTHTAGYVCGAKKGNSSIYYSRPKFVWSADVHLPSITVSPDRVQHFSSESVSLNCGGNSDIWRVMRLTERGHLSNCSYWGSGSGSTCNVSKHSNKTAVYWCETASGKFSNAVNITVQHKNVILQSPAHPVAEGASITLGCRIKNEGSTSEVSFFRNNVKIHANTGGKMRIAAVSQSDEGFYKCRHSGKDSPQSWLSVKSSRPEGSSCHLPLFIGLFCAFLIIIPLQMCWFRKSKNACFARTKSEDTSPYSAPDEEMNVYEVQSSHLNDEDQSSDVLYSPIQIINISNHGKSSPEETEQAVYAEVKRGPAFGP